LAKKLERGIRRGVKNWDRQSRCMFKVLLMVLKLWSEGVEVTSYNLEHFSKFIRKEEGEKYRGIYVSKPEIREHLKTFVGHDVLFRLERMYGRRPKFIHIPTVFSVCTLLVLYLRLRLDVSKGMEVEWLPGAEDMRELLRRFLERVPFDIPLLREIAEAEDVARKVDECLYPVQLRKGALISGFLLRNIGDRRLSNNNSYSGDHVDISKVLPEGALYSVLGDAHSLMLMAYWDARPKPKSLREEGKLKDYEREFFMCELERVVWMLRQERERLRRILMGLAMRLRAIDGGLREMEELFGVSSGSYTC